MIKYKSALKIFLFSALLPVLTALISNWKIDYNSILVFIAYFYLTAYCIKKYRKEIAVWSILLILFAGRCLLSLDVIYNYFTGELWSLPHFVLSIFGIASGFLYLRFKTPFNLLPFLLGSLFAVFMFYQGWEYWIHKRNFGTFTGKVEAYNLPARFEVFDEQKNLITDRHFQNKIVLLDFWHTRCGICFEKFPHLQTAYDKYKNDSSVLIYAVNKPIEEDKPNQAFEIIKEEGYSFPVVIAKDEELPEKFGVKGYPTTFVIDRHGTIVYKGDIEGAVKMVDELKQRG
jgi:thiol-disulfide isomerase/thioredoxin